MPHVRVGTTAQIYTTYPFKVVHVLTEVGVNEKWLWLSGLAAGMISEEASATILRIQSV
jgi:hypothetical protein